MNSMRHYLLPVLLAASATFVGCSTVGATATPARAVFTAKTSYAVALNVAVTYKKLPVCAATVAPPCSNPAVVAQLQKADNVAATALDAAEAAVRSVDLTDDAKSKAVQAAQAALAALLSITNSLGALK